MNGRHPTELLSAYLDGEVTTAERVAVARHLEGCAACRTLLDDFRILAMAAAQEQPPPVPSGMAARIVAALRARPPQPRRAFSPWSPLPLAVAASLLVVVTGTWVVVLRHGEPEPAAVSHVAPSIVDEPAAAPPPLETPPRMQQTLQIGPGDPGERTRLDTRRSKADHREPTSPVEDRPPIAAQAGPEAARPDQEAAGPRQEKDTIAVLESVGYIGNSEKVLPPEARLSPATVDSARGVPAPVDSATAAPAPPSPAAGAQEQRVAPREVRGRSIEFEVSGARGTLTDAGLVTLVLDSGTCSVDLAASPAAVGEVGSIFRIASASPAPYSAARPGRAGEAARFSEPAAAEKKEDAKETQGSVHLIRVLSPTSRPIVATDVERVKDRLQHLLDVTARELIEARCGASTARPPSGD